MEHNYITIMGLAKIACYTSWHGPTNGITEQWW